MLILGLGGMGLLLVGFSQVLAMLDGLMAITHREKFDFLLEIPFQLSVLK